MKLQDRIPITIKFPNGAEVEGVAIIVDIRRDGCYSVCIPNCGVLFDTEQQPVGEWPKTEKSYVSEGIMWSGMWAIKQPLVPKQEVSNE